MPTDCRLDVLMAWIQDILPPPPVGLFDLPDIQPGCRYLKVKNANPNQVTTTHFRLRLNCYLLFYRPITITYSMGQIIKSVCVCQCDRLPSFKRQLKTFLFTKSFPSV